MEDSKLASIARTLDADARLPRLFPFAHAISQPIYPLIIIFISIWLASR